MELRAHFEQRLIDRRLSRILLKLALYHGDEFLAKRTLDAALRVLWSGERRGNGGKHDESEDHGRSSHLDNNLIKV